MTIQKPAKFSPVNCNDPNALGPAILALLVSVTTSFAQGFDAPNNIEVVGVPPIPGSLPRAVQPYANIYGLPVAGWDPLKREIWLNGISNVTWVSRVSSPGAAAEHTSI